MGNTVLRPDTQQVEGSPAIAAPPTGPDYSAITKRVIEGWETAMAELSGETVQCSMCRGVGYHHGFGEDGNDPDWCSQCGGPGYVCIYDDKQISDGAIYAASMVLELALFEDGEAAKREPSSTANTDETSDIHTK